MGGGEAPAKGSARGSALAVAHEVPPDLAAAAPGCPEHPVGTGLVHRTTSTTGGRRGGRPSSTWKAFTTAGDATRRSTLGFSTPARAYERTARAA